MQSEYKRACIGRLITILKAKKYHWDEAKAHREIAAYAAKWLESRRQKQKAGKARWKGVSKKRRSEIARAAVAKRWEKYRERKLGKAMTRFVREDMQKTMRGWKESISAGKEKK